MKNSKAKIGLVSISDRASSGTYQDKGIPSLKEWLAKALLSDYEVVEKLIPDEQQLIEATLKELCDQENCDLILTTGGTGPSRRDVTPEATLAVATSENKCVRFLLPLFRPRFCPARSACFAKSKIMPL